MDGADAVDRELRLIKGAGGALAREKVVASASELFVCIVDETKLTDRLAGPTGDHAEGAPVPLAVLPMATALVMTRVRELGGDPVLRTGFVADDGLAIVDVAGLDLSDPGAGRGRARRDPRGRRVRDLRPPARRRRPRRLQGRRAHHPPAGLSRGPPATVW